MGGLFEEVDIEPHSTPNSTFQLDSLDSLIAMVTITNNLSFIKYLIHITNNDKQSEALYTPNLFP